MAAEDSETPRVQAAGAVLSQDWQPANCVKTELRTPRAFTVSNILTPQECSEIVRMGHQIGYELATNSTTYRSNERAMFLGPELSQALYSRLLPFMSEPEVVIENDDETELYQCEGVWDASSFNELIRIMRYTRGAHFAPHRDAFTRQGPDEVSLFTVLIYLSEGLQGGCTNFIVDSLELDKNDTGIFAAPVDAIVESVTPEVGMALVFYHKLLHEGQRLDDGEKYVLRTDVMYTRRPGTGAQLTQDQLDARHAFEEAERAEADGRIAEAIAFYKRAMRLDPVLARAKGLS